MLDTFTRPLLTSPLESAARKVIDAGVSANQVTFMGFVVGLVGIFAIGFGAYGIGLALILFNRLLDGLDGAVARATVVTEFGRYFDNASNLIILSGFAFFFAMSQPDQAMGAAFLLFSIIALHASKSPVDTGEAKPFYHLSSLAGGTEMIIFIVIVSLYPAAFAATAGVFGTICFITAIGRMLDSARNLR
jgi:phosphatidylglycerophosphate synthase